MCIYIFQSWNSCFVPIRQLNNVIPRQTNVNDLSGFHFYARTNIVNSCMFMFVRIGLFSLRMGSCEEWRVPRVVFRWSHFTLCFFRLGGLLPGHTNPFPHHPNPLLRPADGCVWDGACRGWGSKGLQ